MNLLLPESGLLFWMLLSFGIVFFILAKFGFPVITKMVDERKNYIQDSLDAAHKANEQLAKIKEKSDELLNSAKAEQVKILKDAADTRDRIVNEAREQAKVAGAKELEEIRKQIQAEKEQAIRDIRRQVAELSVDVAEKVLRESLKDPKAQMSMIDRLVDEAMVSKS
ncbi:MAG: F0F1 ATP synthase subunit B [Dysgonomonas sp.]|jgi:F-type H+-transporting ATPase subunit b|uniref:ATP synthase subunit b n=4 Tax=Dysgonomonas TaxID=156973 RepID=F5IYI4_9BACT|nr:MULTISPECIES: F0F1 ATP synthase subunit B [Dysgonomonas]MDR1504137.1 F0F1 ATP synthase subunit B [Prevotella sp.]EGK01619.1 ATP synthase subunit B [Dysgonomonas gadei ATCC BAA-286]MBF0649747.1 F0F1 ATP synthase subunit B [Dysgonomonas sp. GY75]MDR1717892.1 F0F1 ATP synthase subunit B [Prevotella sp.]MDR2002078.1 F0F1 ATP synthase subunit B [Prevotella sp.]